MNGSAALATIVGVGILIFLVLLTTKYRFGFKEAFQEETPEQKDARLKAAAAAGASAESAKQEAAKQQQQAAQNAEQKRQQDAQAAKTAADQAAAAGLKSQRDSAQQKARDEEARQKKIEDDRKARNNAAAAAAAAEAAGIEGIITQLEASVNDLNAQIGSLADGKDKNDLRTTINDLTADIIKQKINLLRADAYLGNEAVTGVSARFVRVYPGRFTDGWLQFSQVMVFNPSLQNVALRKPTFATSIYGSNSKDAPVDGIFMSRADKIFHTGAQISGREVFACGTGYNLLKTEAEAHCAAFSSRLATNAELLAAQQAGAEWCSSGWVSDDVNGSWPMQRAIAGCGGPGLSRGTPPGSRAAANCFGYKPEKGNTEHVTRPFSEVTNIWNQPLNQYWEVDLGAMTPIAFMVFWESAHCCPERNYGIRLQLLNESKALVKEVTFNRDAPKAAKTLGAYSIVRVAPELERTQNQLWTEAEASRRQLAIGNINKCIGVRARRVRILANNCDNGNGWLLFSQVQVWNTAGVNVAVKKRAYATNPAAWGQGGWDQSGWMGLCQPSHAVDGFREARRAPMYHSATQNKTTYWEVDLGANEEIAYIVIFTQMDNPGRFVGAKLQLVNDAGAVINDRLITDNKLEHVYSYCTEGNPQAAAAAAAAAAAGAGLDSVAAAAGAVVPSPFETYLAYIMGLMDPTKPAPTVSSTAFGKYTVPIPDIPAYIKQIAGMTATIAQSKEKEFFEIISKESPVNFLYDFNASTLPTPLQIPIYGDLTPTALSELNENLRICRMVYLGSPNDVDRYLRIALSDLKLYMRTQNSRPYCQLEVINRSKDGVFITEELPVPIAQNGTNCSYEINSDRLALFPPNARNFIKNWAFNRTKRMTQYKFRTLAAADLDAKINAVQYIQPNTYGLDISQKTTLDMIAQAFYEMLDGKYSMSQIYDIFPIGSSILDIRFELVRHKDPAPIQAKIDALQAKFKKLVNSNVTQDIIDQAQEDYDAALEELQTEQSEAVEDPIPMLGRFFYKRENGVFVITGFTLDQRAVTSFIPELNCGMTVTEFDEKVRTDTGTYKFVLDGDGNVNYTTITRYTKNPTPDFDIKSPDLLRTIMRDYQDAATTDLSGAFASATPTWDLSGSLVVTEVLGGKKLGTSQCILRWREAVLDEETNQFVRSNIERTALFSYVKNEDDWFAKEFVFDASGFKFLTTDSIGECKWDPAAYKAAGGTALAAMTTDQLKADFLGRGLSAGLSACPSVNPGGRFDAAVYEGVNPGMGFNGNTYALRNHYISYGINEGRSIVGPAKLDLFTPTIKLRRPLPAEFLLDDANGLCPARSCADTKLLYKIVQQYNEDEENPGNILRVVKATTPSPLQCDMELDIDYSVKKGGKAAPAGLTGVKRETRSFTLDLDKGSCDYSLMEAGDPGSGTSILDTTPALYRPMEYATEFKEDNGGILKSVFDSINGVVGQVLSRAKSALNIYRANTYAAVGNLVPFDGCPTTKCSNPEMIQKFITFYDENNWKTHRLTKVLRAGNSSGTACDYTFERAAVSIGADGRPALGPTETAGLRVTAEKLAAGTCAFRFLNPTPVLPSPPEEVIQNTANKDFNIANLYSEGGVNVTNSRPYRWINCRTNGTVNFLAANDAQIKTMLATAKAAGQAPTLTIKNDTVAQCSFTGGGVSKKIQIDLDSFGNPNIAGTSSPADASFTPARTIAATSTALPLAQPVTAAPNCATLNTVFATLPTVLEGKQKSPTVCEVRVMGEPELGLETSFGNIYKEVEYYQETDGSYQLVAVRPAPQDTSLYKDAFKSSITLDPKAADLMAAARAYIKDKKPTWRLGRILRAGTDSTGAILYEATLAILDANGAPVSFYSAPSTSPAIMRVTFRRGLTEPKAPYVTSLELAGSANSSFVAVTDAAGVALTDPFTAVYKYKTIKFTVTKARGSTEAQLMRLELFKNNIRVPAGNVKISIEGKPDVKADMLMETAAMEVAAPEKASFLTLPVPFTVVVSMTPPDEVDSFSFMTGPDPNKDPLRWVASGSANDTLWKQLTVQDSDATYPDYGLWRIGQTSFTGRPTGEVTQNAARLKGLKECGYRPTDTEIIQFASDLVYSQHSKSMPGYSASKLNSPRAYLAGIQAYEYKERENVITFMPVIHYVLDGFIVQELREDGPKLPYIRLAFNKVTDCVPTIDTAASKVEVGRPTGATFIPFPQALTQKTLGAKVPFAWGGYPSALKDKFRLVGNYQFSKQNAAGESNEYKVVTYASSGPDAPTQIPFGASTYTLAPEGGAQICAGDPKCVAFFDSSELGGKYSGVFYSAPTANTRLTDVQPRAYQSTNDFLARTISESSQNLYVKKEYELFRQVRLTGLKARSPLSVDVQLGKIIFYAGTTPIKVTPNSAMNLDTQLAMSGTPASPTGSGAVNLFSYTTDTQWVAPTTGLGGVVFSFDMPIVASGYSIVSGTQDYSRDLVRWKLEVSMDGRTWKVLDDKTAKDQDIPQARRLEQRRVDFYPDLIKATIGEGFETYVAPKVGGMDFGMKTLGGCEKTCDDDGLLNTMMGVYAEKTGNKMNVTSVGYDAGANECVVGYDDGTSKNKVVGFQFTPTFDSCETMTAPANIKMNEMPKKPADQLLARRPVDTPYRYIRFRPQVLAGGGSAVQLGKIVFFQGGKIHPLTGAVVVNPSGTDKTVEGPLSRNTAPAAIDYATRTAQWTDTTLGTLHITLPQPAEFDAFTLVTGSDPRRAPVRWTLESSTDGRIWRPLHMQNDSDVTAPTSQFTQYLMYFFDSKKEPIAVRNMFEKSLGSFGKRCDDMDILEAVSQALARQNPPILFSPTKFAYNETLNKCDYVQSQDSSIVGVYLNTDVYGNTAVRGIEKKSTTVGPTPSEPVASGRLFGLEECLVGPAACERPALVDYVKNNYERRDFRKNKDIGQPQTGFPLSVRGFGLDSARNECVYELDDAYVPPLYQTPQIVGVQFKKGTSCSASGPEVLGDIQVRDKNVLPLTRAAVSSVVKYVRFRPFKVRSPAAGGVRMGGLELFNGDEPVSMNGVQVSNPMGTWIGSAADFAAAGWEDKHKKALVFAFPSPVRVSHYSWRTAKEGSEGEDPVRWKLEGSPNGTFWMTLHDMSMEETSVPTARGAETQKYAIKL